MSVLTTALVTSRYASSTETTEYTSDRGTRTILDKFTAYNGHTAAVLVTVKLVQQGGSAGGQHVVASKSIQPGETYTFPEVVGHVLEAGGFVSVLASTASAVVIRISGRMVS